MDWLVALLASLVVGLGCSGCGKKKSAETAPAATQEVAQATTQKSDTTAAQSAPGPQATPQASAEPIDLNRELRRLIVRNRRPPKNFEDFAATSGVEIPPPPDGKRYAIDKTMHIILVKR